MVSLKQTHKKNKGKTWGDEHTTLKHRLDNDPLVKKLIKFSVGPFLCQGLVGPQERLATNKENL